MTTSLAQSTCLPAFTADQLDSLSTFTSSISISPTINCHTTSYTSAGCITYTIPTLSTTSLNNIHITNIWGRDEWNTDFPEWARIQKMCETYPGLKIAFDKFKTTYMLVKDDFDAPEDKKIKP